MQTEIDFLTAEGNNVTPPSDMSVDLNPLLPELTTLIKLTPEEAFDYKGALEEKMTPTQIVNTVKNRFGFKAAQAREAFGNDDSMVLELLMQNSEQAKVNVANSKQNAAGMDEFDLGWGSFKAGVGQTVNSILNTMYIKDDDDYKATKETLKEFALDMERARSDKDFFSKFTAGDMAAQIGAMPFAVQGRIATAVVEGALGWMSGYREADTTNAAIEGGASAALGATISHLLRGVDGRKMGDLNRKVESEFLTTDVARDQFEEYLLEYKKVINVKNEATLFDSSTWTRASDDAVTRTAALVDFLGGPGAELKREAADMSLDATSAIRNIEQQRADSVSEVLKNTGTLNIQELATSLGKGINVVKDNFGRVVDSMGVVKTNNSHLLGGFTDDIIEQLDEATATDIKTLRSMLEEGTVGSLIEARQHANQIIRTTSKTKRARKFKLQDLVKSIDKQIEMEVSPQKFAEFQAINRDYKMMANVRDSKAHLLIDAAAKGDITAERAMTELYKVSEGSTLFKDIETLIGTEQTSKLEKLMVKEALGTNSIHTWKKLGTQIDNKGFVTPEGKALRDTIQKFGELFQIDDIAKLDSGHIDFMQGGAKSDVKSQVMGTLIKQLAMSIQKHIPFSEVRSRAISKDHFYKILSKPQELKKFIEKAEKISPPLRAKMVEEVMAKLPRTPETRPEGIKNLENPKDLIFDSYMKSEVIQKGVNDAFKDAMFSNLSNSELNKVTTNAFKHFDETRFTDRMNSIGNSMTEGKLAGNAKRLKAVLRNEAEMLGKAISKDTGAKVDDEMMDTLVNYVTKRAIEDCD